MVVALARKLLIALWRFVIDGVLPEGAVLKPRAWHRSERRLGESSLILCWRRWWPSQRRSQLALDRLMTAGLLFRQGAPPHSTYLFKHALVQDVRLWQCVAGIAGPYGDTQLYER